MWKKILAASIMSLSLQALAADKALLIGVGEHQDARNNLPGIDLDITNMKQAAKLLGFNNIKTLENSQATESNIKKQLRWLTKGVGKDDRVLLYFSGHGSQMRDRNGDEADRLDEFLVAYDFGVTGNTPRGYILDDDLNRALSKIPSRNVYVVVDACQSGTSTKSVAPYLGVSEAMPKYLKYVGMPQDAGIGSRGIAVQEADSDDNFVAISAAGDTEYALAGRTGSYFTLGVMASLRKMMAEGRTGITPKQLHKEVVRFVHNKTTNQNRFTPVLSGSERLASKRLGLKKTSTQGTFWRELERLASSFGGKLDVNSNSKVYSVGQEIVMNVNVPQNGYLNIITTDANDKPQILFPNKFMRNNYVQKGVFSTRSLAFDLTASNPKGNNLTVAIVTTQPLNLYEKSTLGRNEKGELTIAVADLDAVGLKDVQMRAITVTQSASSRNRPQTWAGKVVTKVR